MLTAVLITNIFCTFVARSHPSLPMHLRPLPFQTVVHWDCLMSMSHEYYCEESGYSIIYSITPESKTKMSPTQWETAVFPWFVPTLEWTLHARSLELKKIDCLYVDLAIAYCYSLLKQCQRHVHMSTIFHKLFHSFPISFRSSNTMCYC